jgi:hypothetical protein
MNNKNIFHNIATNEKENLTINHWINSTSCPLFLNMFSNRYN